MYFLQVIEILAILASGYSGAVEAKRNGMDYVGVATVAMVTAFGGGTLRDLLIGRRPLYWIEHYEITIYIFLLSLATVIAFRFNKNLFSKNALLVIDAVGLGLFSASGVGIALAMQTHPFPAALIGVMTATFGGVFRDVLSNKMPQLFQHNTPLYATCAFVGAWIYILFIFLGFPHPIGLTACIFVTFWLRIVAVRFNLNLPF